MVEVRGQSCIVRFGSLIWSELDIIRREGSPGMSGGESDLSPN